MPKSHHTITNWQVFDFESTVATAHGHIGIVSDQHVAAHPRMDIARVDRRDRFLLAVVKLDRASAGGQQRSVRVIVEEVNLRVVSDWILVDSFQSLRGAEQHDVRIGRP